MVKYNLRIFVRIMVFLSIIVFLILYKISYDKSGIDNINEAWSIAGKTAVVVTLVSLFFEKCAWKWRVFRKWLVQTPYLGGEWNGSVKYEDNGCLRQKKVEVVVKQSFLYLSVSLKTNESSSSTISSSFNIDNERNICQLWYVYRNEPNISIREKSSIHYGTARLDVNSNDLLEGCYWTDRQTRGSMLLNKVKK